MNDEVAPQRKRKASEQPPFSAFARPEKKPKNDVSREDRKYVAQQQAAIAVYDSRTSLSAASTVRDAKSKLQEFLKLPEEKDLPTSSVKQERIGNKPAGNAEDVPEAERRNRDVQGKADAGELYSRYGEALLLENSYTPKRVSTEEIAQGEQRNGNAQGKVDAGNIELPERLRAPNRSPEVSNDAKAAAERQTLLEQSSTLSPEPKTNVQLNPEAATKPAFGEGHTGAKPPNPPAEPSREKISSPPPPSVPPPIDSPPSPMSWQESRSNSTASKELSRQNVHKGEIKEVRAQEEVTQVFQVLGVSHKGFMALNGSTAMMANEVGGGALNQFGDKKNAGEARLSDDLSRIHTVDTKQLVPPGQAVGGRIIRDEASVRDNDANYMCISTEEFLPGAFVAARFRSPVYIEKKQLDEAFGEPRVDVTKLAKDEASFVISENNGRFTGAFYGRDGKKLEADQIPRIGAERGSSYQESLASPSFAEAIASIALGDFRGSEKNSREGSPASDGNVEKVGKKWSVSDKGLDCISAKKRNTQAAFENLLPERASAVQETKDGPARGLISREKYILRKALESGKLNASTVGMFNRLDANGQQIVRDMCHQGNLPISQAALDLACAQDLTKGLQATNVKALSASKAEVIARKPPAKEAVPLRRHAMEKVQRRSAPSKTSARRPIVAHGWGR